MGNNLGKGVDIFTLANTQVFDEDGQKMALGLVWKDQKTILVFLRHFACIACRAHAAQVWADRQKYESTGAKIVFVGNGLPQYIKSFKEDLKIEDARMLTDPSLLSFMACGFRRGFMYVVHPQNIISVARLALAGHKQVKKTPEMGTHWQLGGVVAVSTTGTVLYHHISESLGDFGPEPAEQVASLIATK